MTPLTPRVVPGSHRLMFVSLLTAGIAIGSFGSTTVTAQALAPVARSVVVATQQDVAKTGVLPATDPESDPLTFSVVTPPTKGALLITNAATGAFTYTPNAGAVGYDTFTFQAADATAFVHGDGRGLHRHGDADVAGPDGAGQRRQRRQPARRTEQPGRDVECGRAVHRVHLGRLRRIHPDPPQRLRP